jgi:hypothetical protein
MTFFTAVNGHLYATDLVAEIVLPEGASEADVLKHWHREGHVVLRSGAKIAVEYGQLLALLAAPAYLVPAAPGTVILSYDPDRDRMWQTAVTAWAYTQKGEVVPVTAVGLGYSRHTDAVMAPDGSIDNHMASWPNEDAWRAWAMNEHEGARDADG